MLLMTTRTHLLGSILFGVATLLARAGELEETARSFAKIQTLGLPGRVEVTIGANDVGNKLGPCQAFEPFLPAGGRMWGRSTVGVRCLGPSSWTVFIPVQISVFGSYLRSTHVLAAGQPITAADFTVVEADLTTLPTGVLTEPAQAIGKPARVGLAAGQPLRSDQIISPPAIRQGQTVKLVTRGPGFVVSGEGRALNTAAEGQSVQVRAASGQTVSGIARAGGVVEIAF